MVEIKVEPAETGGAALAGDNTEKIAKTIADARVSCFRVFLIG